MDNLWAVWIVVAVAAVIVLAVYAYGISTIVKRPELTTQGRVLWILALLFFPLITAIVWYVWGPSKVSRVIEGTVQH